MPPVDIELVSSLAYKDTELTLGLPGSTSTTTTTTTTTTESTWSSESVSSSGQIKNSTNLNCKRGIVETVGVDFLGSKPHATTTTHEDDKLEHTNAAAVKGQVIGWPPVRSSIRKKAIKYVKVGADGEPFLRKIDLHMFTSYEQLLRVLHQMFYCFTIWGGYLEQSKAEKGMEYYLPTYEDTDGDLMLVGDVSWKMFIESCKRIRLMKSSEAIGLGNIIA